METFRIYAPDTVGHPGRSAETRISPGDASYGLWALDVLDGLGMQRVPVIGLSYGAGILLKLAAMEPRRIARAVLLVPAGVERAPMASLVLRLAWPMVSYRLSPTPERLRRAVQPLCAEEPPATWSEAIGAVFRGVRLETRMPSIARPSGLAGFRAQALAIAGEHDPLFPASRVFDRIPKILPQVSTISLLSERHLLSDRGLRTVNNALSGFLASA